MNEAWDGIRAILDSHRLQGTPDTDKAISQIFEEINKHDKRVPINNEHIREMLMDHTSVRMFTGRDLYSCLKYLRDKGVLVDFNDYTGAKR